MKHFLLIAAALLGLSAPALAQTRALPPGEIRANGDITFGNALKLGKREGNKTVITPDTLQILGSGSTGDVSATSVNGASLNKAVGFSGLTRAAIATSLASAVQTTIVTAGTAAAGDRGAGCTYIRTAVAGANALKDALGVWWSLAPGQPFRVDCFRTPGANDDTAAFNAAMAAANAAASGAGGTVLAQDPAGYTIAGGLITPNGVALVGGGHTPLTCTAASGTCITLVGDKASATGFWLRRSDTSNSVVGIQLGNGENGQKQKVADNYIDLFGTAVNVRSGVSWDVARNNIRASRQYGIRVNNTVHPDSGDGAIAGNTISNADVSYGESAIRYETGGGLKVSGNKILSFARGLDLQIPAGAHTVDLLMTLNSIENQTVASIRTGRVPGGDGTFSTVTIAGNQLAGAPVGVALEPGSYNTTVTGNAFNLFTTAGITIADDVEPVAIPPGGNTFVATATPILDTRGPLNASPIEQVYGRAFMATSTSAWTNLGRIAVPNYRAATVTVIFEGILQNVGGFSKVQRFIFGREGGNVAVTNDGTSAGYGPAFDVNIDVTSSPGSAIVQVRRNASDNAGSNALQGAYTVRLGGKVGAYYPL